MNQKLGNKCHKKQGGRCPFRSPLKHTTRFRDARRALISGVLSLFLMFPASCGLSAAEPEATPTLAIVDINVIDMTGGPARAGQTVLVVGDRITRIAPSGEVKVPTRTRVLEGKGRWLIPGLWDMHAHTSNPDRDLPLYLANGITGIRDLGGEAEGNPARAPSTFSITWKTLRPVRDAIRAGQRPGPRIFAGGVMLDAPKPWPGTLGVSGAEDARRIVRRLHNEKVDFIKIGTGVTPEVHAAIIAEAQKMGVPIAGHVPGGMTALAVAKAGQVSVEHLMGLPGSCFANAGPDANCRASLRELAATDVSSVPTLAAWRGRLLATDPSVNNRPEHRFVPNLTPIWAAEATGINEVTAERNRRTFAQFIKVTGALRAEGVRVMAGTDCGNAFTVPGFSIHDELRLLVEAGFSPHDALTAATVAPARFFRLSDETGTITSGKRADLVLLDGNPLVDIGNTTRISAVVLGGKLLNRADLDRLLEDAIKVK